MRDCFVWEAEELKVYELSNPRHIETAIEASRKIVQYVGSSSSLTVFVFN